MNSDLSDIERDMWGDPPEEPMNLSDTHTAVLVLNRNMREMTESLIETIRKTSKAPHTIYTLEADSDADKIARNGDVSIEFSQNRRWAWSFARGMELVVKPASAMKDPSARATTFTDDIRRMGFVSDHDCEFGRNLPDPTHFWLLCNDTQLDPDLPTLDILLENIPTDACQIHPYQTTHPRGSTQGWSGIPPGHRLPEAEGRVHNVAFVEFVCPLITRDFYDRCLANFGCPPVGPHFPYGWGVDYEMAFFGHQLKLKSYICDAVGITHHPGTTHLHHQETKVEDNNEMRVRARNTMLDVLEQRYGRDWGDKFALAARKAGVDPQAFLDWSAHDRALAARGVRI